MKSVAAEISSDVEPASQFAAMPWRHVEGVGIEVLLVTSRISKHWLLPKGWLIRGKSETASACREAFEEAGVEGKARNKAVGQYDYIKVTKTGEHIACRVTVFGLKVKRELEEWPEATQRTRQWFSIPDAAALVTEPGLRDFLLSIDASNLKA